MCCISRMRQSVGQAGGDDPWRARRRLEHLHSRLHDPAHYRIVLFDQRGAGKSTPAPRSSPTPPATSSPTWSCASISRSSAGSRAAAPGLDPGAGLCERHPRGSASWSCAASSRCAASSSNGSTRRAPAASFPMPGKIRTHTAGRARRHDRCLLPAADRRRSGPRAALRPRLSHGRARRSRCCPIWRGWRASAPTSSPSPSHRSSAIISFMAAFERDGQLDRGGRTGWPISLASSSMAAMTFARRWPMPGTSNGHGRRRHCASSRTPDTP